MQTAQSEGEARLFRQFKDKVIQDDEGHNETRKDDIEQSSDNPYFHIHEETGFIHEVKDIRDELNILKSLLEDQRGVWNQAFGESTNTTAKSNYLQSRNPAEAIEEIVEMDEDAERVQNAVGYTWPSIMDAV